MIWLVMMFMSAVCVLLQAAIVPMAFLGQAKVPLLLAVVVYYSLNYDTGSAAVAALICGYLHDVMSFVPMGQTAMLFFVIALVCGRFRKLVHGESVFTSGLCGGAAAFFFVMISYSLLSRDGLVAVSSLNLWHKAFGSFFLGMISTPIVCLAARKIDALVGNIATTEVIEDVLD